MAPQALAEALGMIAPASLTSITAARSFVGAMGQIDKSIRASSNEALRFAVSGGGAKIIQDVQQAFAKATSELTLPEMLAFGGGQEPGVDPWEAVQKTFGKDMDRTTMLVNYFRKVAESAAAGQSEMAIFAAAEKKLGGGQTAFAAVEAIQTMMREQGRRGASDKDKLDAQARATDKIAMASAALDDPMQKLVSIATAMMTALFSLIDIFKPGAGSVLASRIDQANPATKPMRQAVGAAAP